MKLQPQAIRLVEAYSFGDQKPNERRELFELFAEAIPSWSKKWKLFYHAAKNGQIFNQ